MDVTIHAEMLLQRHKLTPYLGRRVSGEVRGTWMRGQRLGEEKIGSVLRRGAG